MTRTFGSFDLSRETFRVVTPRGAYGVFRTVEDARTFLRAAFQARMDSMFPAHIVTASDNVAIECYGAERGTP